MLVSYRWLQEYVQIPWGPQELADRLTMAGLEVEGIKFVAEHLENVYVGKIKEIQPHANADTLQVCTVDVGEQGTHTIVCGAPNVSDGQTVAVALPGAELPGDFRITETEIRGVASSGMICSLVELGLGEDGDGIWVLADEHQAGTPLVELYELDDAILDVSIYANRPDCMSMLGIAREVAALTGGKVKFPQTDYETITESIADYTRVTVEDPVRCPRYTATLLKGITVRESPLWMQFRLRAAGMRPINNIVDITNYVMLETGQPLHAFDFHKLSQGELVIRTAKPGEKLVTLDGDERTLTKEMLVICDAHSPQCIAGVMGGLDSEVTAESKKILLEAANFAPLGIRRTSRSLGLTSESSARFEKGINPQGTLYASQRAAHLLQNYADAQVFAGNLDADSTAAIQTKIELRLNQIERLLGVSVPTQKAKNILESLEFSVEETSDDKWSITVPFHRGDIEIEADIIEEIVRIWGLEKLPSTLPGGSFVGGQSRRLDLIDKFREILVGAGLQEALTYSFGRKDNNQRLRRQDSPMILVQNPISEDLIAMRHSLLPGLLTAASLNASRQQSRVALFEIGATYHGDLPLKKQPEEEFVLGVLLWGLRTAPNWGVPEAEFDFYDLKGIIEALLPQTGELDWVQGENPTLHPYRQGSVYYKGNEIAYFGEIHPAVAREFRLSGRVYAAEIYFEKILDLYYQTPTFQDLPRYPAMDRDLAVILDNEQPVGEMIKHLQSVGGELLTEVNVFDLYVGKPIPAGKKSVAFSFRFQGQRTLTDEEVNKIMAKILAELEANYGAEIR